MVRNVGMRGPQMPGARSTHASWLIRHYLHEVDRCELNGVRKGLTPLAVESQETHYNRPVIPIACTSIAYHCTSYHSFNNIII